MRLTTNKHTMTLLVLAAFSAIGMPGCYAPLRSPGINARDLPDDFRFPVRTNRDRLNLAELTIPKVDGQVGRGDLLSVHVHGLSDDPTNQPIQVRVLEDGRIDLPLVGSVSVAGLTLPGVRDEVVRAYQSGKFLKSAQVSVQVVEPAMVQVVVMGEVRTPGVYTMPRNGADVGRVLALAGGLTESAGDSVEVHGNSPSTFAKAEPQAQPLQYSVPSQPSQPNSYLYPNRDTDSGGGSFGPPPVPPSSDTGVEMDIREIDDRGIPLPDAATGTLLEVPQASSAKRDSGIQQVSFMEAEREFSFGHSQSGRLLKAASAGAEASPRATPLIAQPDPMSSFSRTFAPDPEYGLGYAAPQPLSAAGFRQPTNQGVATETFYDAAPIHTCIALSGPDVRPLASEEVRLRDGDVVSVPKAVDDVFYVVGPLSDSNRTNFNIGSKELRQIGGGFLLPRDRDIDVVTGVAMAGYIDPINSPTTVTVHRRLADGRSLLIRVSLIEARYDRRDTVLLRPGDIVYLNPDSAWWSRRLFDQVAPQMFLLPWRFWTQDWILGAGGVATL